MLTVVREEARRRGIGNLRTVLGEAQALPFADYSFYLVVSRVAAHHFRDPAGAVREMARVVRPGGRVLMVDTGAAEEDGRD